jgi:hypothetical protein
MALSLAGQIDESESVIVAAVLSGRTRGGCALRLALVELEGLEGECLGRLRLPYQPSRCRCCLGGRPPVVVHVRASTVRRPKRWPLRFLSAGISVSSAMILRR